MKIIKNVNVYDFYTYSHNNFVVFEEKIITKDSMKGYNSYLKYLRENLIESEIIDGEGGLLMPSSTLEQNYIYSDLQREWVNPFDLCDYREILDQLGGERIDASNLKEWSQLELDTLHKRILACYHSVSEKLGSKIGRIEKGYQADLIIIPDHPFNQMTESDAFYHYINCIREQIHPKNQWMKGMKKKDMSSD